MNVWKTLVRTMEHVQTWKAALTVPVWKVGMGQHVGLVSLVNMIPKRNQQRKSVTMMNIHTWKTGGCLEN